MGWYYKYDEQLLKMLHFLNKKSIQLGMLFIINAGLIPVFVKI